MYSPFAQRFMMHVCPKPATIQSTSRIEVDPELWAAIQLDIALTLRARALQDDDELGISVDGKTRDAMFDPSGEFDPETGAVFVLTVLTSTMSQRRHRLCTFTVRRNDADQATSFSARVWVRDRVDYITFNFERSAQGAGQWVVCDRGETYMGARVRISPE
jgi:hypothetical protein